MPGLLLFLTALLAQAQTPPATASGFVGGNVCRACHPDKWLDFYKNPHYKSVASGTAAPEDTGCEGCHGPGKAHVEARGGKTTIPRAFSLMPPKEILDACLRCHSKDFSRANIRRSQHTLSDVVCSNCHSIHKAAGPKFLLAKKQADLCYDCHASVRAQFSMPFKHRVNEGFMQCTDCHNPHGSFAPTWRTSQRPRLVEHALGNEEACLKCHSDKRGPFIFEHPPVRVEGCESCHSPHGSMNGKLLRRPAVFSVCLECHNGAGNFGRQGDGIKTQSGGHNMFDRRFQNCTACHVRIHGSNSEQLFFR
ncbi:MAG: DmsE family decaheme c-type cytochrome [Acidobacteria bacterium]|nr:DmsE family decaheme c-type cytochrome [Acidobacteriota bacterium]MBI3473282.1 DmsE family decaheme c-type cytochrome [Candidatus Solibacter usitatus]